MIFKEIKFSSRYSSVMGRMYTMYGSPVDEKVFRSTGVGVVLENGKVYVGVSVCSDKDVFSRSEGFNIAKGRCFSTIAKDVYGDKCDGDYSELLGDQKEMNDTVKALLVTKMKHERDRVMRGKIRERFVMVSSS